MDSMDFALLVGLALGQQKEKIVCIFLVLATVPHIHFVSARKVFWLVDVGGWCIPWLMHC